MELDSKQSFVGKNAQNKFSNSQKLKDSKMVIQSASVKQTEILQGSLQELDQQLAKI